MFVTPGDLDGLTAALLRLTTDETVRAAMGAAALARASQLSWRTCAQAALAALEDAAR
jgi:glycosyltransferase involved in cell wall biosynthesis